jgi:hypothetical protein
MPYQLSHDKTPAGVPMVRYISSGRILAGEAAELMTQISAGGPFYGLPMLVISMEGVEVTAEARRVFTQRIDDEKGAPTAIVTTNVVMRVTINFIGRVNRGANMRMFATEAEALRWLDEQCAPAATKH